MTVPLRAALYLRVSTARQAEHDVSIPDQKRQGEAYCQSRGYQLVETYVEPGASATNDRQPGRRAGYARRSQFCSEMAERKGFERSTLNRKPSVSYISCRGGVMTDPFPRPIAMAASSPAGRARWRS